MSASLPLAALPAIGNAVKEAANTPVIGYARDTVEVRVRAGAKGASKEVTKHETLTFTVRAWELAALGLLGILAYATEAFAGALGGASTPASAYEWTQSFSPAFWVVEAITYPATGTFYMFGLPLLTSGTKHTTTDNGNGTLTTLFDPPLQLKLPPWHAWVLPVVTQPTQ